MLYVFSRSGLKKAAILSAFLLVASFTVTTHAATATAEQASSGALSFREWKQSRLDQIQVKIENLRQQIGQQRRHAGTDPNMKSMAATEAGMPAQLQSELEAEQQALVMTRELTISDYFVGYLTKQPSVDGAIKQVSGRLTPDEVAELMSAYANQFVRTRPASRKVSPRADSGL